MTEQAPPKKGFSFAEFYRRFGISILLVLLFVISASINRNFLKPQNLINILKQISVVGIISCGTTMLVVSRMIDLSAGLVCSMSACFAAGVLVRTGSLPLTFLVGIGTGMCAGWINGFLITKYRLQPFIATLAMQNIAKGITQVYTGGVAINGVEKIRWLGQGSILGMPVPVWIMLLMMTLTFLMMKFTKVGLYIYAVGGNERSAAASGVNVGRMRRTIYLMSGFMVGLAGVVLVARMMSGQPGVGEGYEFDAITAVVIGGGSMLGGVGNVAGTLAGAVIVGMINNILNLLNVSTQYQLIAKGLLIAFAVILDTQTKSAKEAR